MRTGFRDVPSYIDEDDREATLLQQPQRFPHLKTKVKGLTRKKKARLNNSTLLKIISEEWNKLSDSEKDDWNTIAENMGRNGWQLFTQDLSYRIKHELSYPPTPDSKYQTWVGHLHIGGDESYTEMYQYHAHRYFLKVPKEGYRKMKKKIKVMTWPTNPLEIRLSYKTDLKYTGSGTEPRLGIKTDGYTDYGYIESEYFYDLPHSSTWTTFSEDFNNIRPGSTKMRLAIYIYENSGDIWFDNLELNIDGVNHAIDPYFEEVNEELVTLNTQGEKKPFKLVTFDEPDTYFERSFYAS